MVQGRIGIEPDQAEKPVTHCKPSPHLSQRSPGWVNFCDSFLMEQGHTPVVALPTWKS